MTTVPPRDVACAWQPQICESRPPVADCLSIQPCASGITGCFDPCNDTGGPGPIGIIFFFVIAIVILKFFLLFGGATQRAGRLLSGNGEHKCFLLAPDTTTTEQGQDTTESNTVVQQNMQDIQTHMDDNTTFSTETLRNLYASLLSGLVESEEKT